MANWAALNTGPDFHLLDHIAPLADLLEIPLLVAEEKNYEMAKKFYPQVTVRHAPDLEFRLGDLASEFDMLFECKFWLPHLQELFRNLHKKEMRLVFCPHGQSDKGYQAPLLAPYALQDRVLLYGDLLAQMLKEVGVWDDLPPYAKVGNYRLAFYRKYQEFYDELAENEIYSHLRKDYPTLIYAPTWRDADQATSFFTFGQDVVAQLPADWNLIIKLHPLLEQRDPALFYKVTGKMEGKDNVVIVSDFPSIYPILARADAYLGDSSSVGYDFLAFQRPLFFLPLKGRERLHSCGHVVTSGHDLSQKLNLKNPCIQHQKDLYHFAFGDADFDSAKIRKEIEMFM